jgi:hypothetical protein
MRREGGGSSTRRVGVDDDRPDDQVPTALVAAASTRDPMQPGAIRRERPRSAARDPNGREHAASERETRTIDGVPSRRAAKRVRSSGPTWTRKTTRVGQAGRSTIAFVSARSSCRSRRPCAPRWRRAPSNFGPNRALMMGCSRRVARRAGRLGRDGSGGRAVRPRPNSSRWRRTHGIATTTARIYPAPRHAGSVGLARAPVRPVRADDGGRRAASPRPGRRAGHGRSSGPPYPIHRPRQWRSRRFQGALSAEPRLA